MADVAGFDRRDFPLREAHVAQFEGFVFVSIADRPEPFEEAFAPLLGRFARWNLGALRTVRTIAYELACNWKLVFQNYSECYSLSAGSPTARGAFAVGQRSQRFERRTVSGRYSELRPGTSLTCSGTSARPPLGGLTGAELERAYYYTIFPSLLLSLHPDYVMVHYVMPLAADRTRIACAWLFDPATAAALGFDPADVVDFWDLTNRQDWRINELTHAGVGSRAYVPGPYANAEGLLAAFDWHYLRTMSA